MNIHNNQLKSAHEILEILSKHGEAYIVGGTVRDILLERESNDIDICTNVPVNIIESLFETFDIGKNKDFGVSVIKYKNNTFEIAQFRSDGNYSDGRHPDNIQITDSFKEDCKRRDFTINALAVDINSNIIDYYNGIYDLKKEIIKTVGNANTRFKEDYLRMLRAIRFSSTLNFNIEDDTFKAIQFNAFNILNISQERIMKEIWKMASQSGNKFADAILLLDKSNLLKYILPEIIELKKCEHSPIHHPEGNPFEHSIAALRTYKGNDPIINFAILFHDIGKPKAYKLKNNKHTYYNHESIGVTVIKEIANRMKWDNKLKDIVCYTTKQHMRFHLIPKMKDIKVLRLMDHEYWKYLKIVGYADGYSRGDVIADVFWNNFLNKVNHLKSAGKTTKLLHEIRKKYDGKYIMKVKGFDQPDKLVGNILKNLPKYILKNNIDINDTDKVDDYIRQYR